MTIINEILDITRIEAGKMPMQLSEFNLNELVPEVMTELDPVISRSKLTVAPKLCSDLPTILQRSAEGEADYRESAEQRVEVHA
jgi:signal transduction histidine kinase